MIAPIPRLSVVIATYNRAESLERLLEQLGVQTLDSGHFEVIIVDDGSIESIAVRLQGRSLSYVLRVISQPNAGAAAARDRGIRCTAGEIIVLLDDDMQIGPNFLARHLAQHATGCRQIVLGRIRLDSSAAIPLFERFHASTLEHLALDVQAGRLLLSGTHVTTGNVSFRRSDYLAVGGFDTSLKYSEDAELGVRLQQAGVKINFCEDACSVHSSDHQSLNRWMQRAFLYGRCDQRIARKHSRVLCSDPWRYLFLVHPSARPLLFASALAPWLMRPAAWILMWAALGLDRVGASRLAIAGATVVYGIQYFSGVRQQAGSIRQTIVDCRQYCAHRQSAVQT